MKITVIVENDTVRETLEEEFDIERGLVIVGLVASMLTRTFDAEYARQQTVKGTVVEDYEDTPKD